jgi:tetratricopeptide (TPR) repeat protein
MLSERPFCAPRSYPRIAALLLIGISAASPGALAQRAAEHDRESPANAPTRRTPTIRQAVYEGLAKAQACLEAEGEDGKSVGTQCVLENLAKLRERDDLTGFEAAQMWNVYAYTYFQEDNYPEAIHAYEMVLAQDDLTAALEQSTMYSLATLYVQRERYADGLELLDRWFETQESPSPDAWYLKAQVHYQLQQYAEAVEPMRTAIGLAEELGREPQESWYQLLYVTYFELEDYPRVIETLTFMLEHWLKRDYLMQLAAVYSQEGRDTYALALYEGAFEMGWLERGPDLVTFSQMLMNADIPYKAAVLMQRGLDSGVVESSESNWRLLAQAWQLAQQDEKAIPALTKASSLASDGELDLFLAQAYSNLARWDECIETSRTGLERGLERAGQLNVLLASCFAATKNYAEARKALHEAARVGDEQIRRSANDYMIYIHSEEAQELYMRESIEALEHDAQTTR